MLSQSFAWPGEVIMVHFQTAQKPYDQSGRLCMLTNLGAQLEALYVGS